MRRSRLFLSACGLVAMLVTSLWAQQDTTRDRADRFTRLAQNADNTPAAGEVSRFPQLKTRLVAGEHTRTVTVGSLKRRYLAHLPKNYDDALMWEFFQKHPMKPAAAPTWQPTDTP